MTNLLAIQLHQVEWNETCRSLAPSVSLELLVAVQLEPKSGNAVTRGLDLGLPLYTRLCSVHRAPSHTCRIEKSILIQRVSYNNGHV
jgi:hypothetical protein